MTNNVRTPSSSPSPVFVVGQTYQTRDGKPVQITEVREEDPDFDYMTVHGIYLDTIKQTKCSWCANGSFWGKQRNYQECPEDLILS